MIGYIFVGDRPCKTVDISPFVSGAFLECIDTGAIRNAALNAIGTTVGLVSVHIPALNIGG
jgi:hypothetical protein